MFSPHRFTKIYLPKNMLDLENYYWSLWYHPGCVLFSRSLEIANEFCFSNIDIILDVVFGLTIWMSMLHRLPRLKAQNEHLEMASTSEYTNALHHHPPLGVLHLERPLCRKLSNGKWNYPSPHPVPKPLPYYKIYVPWCYMWIDTKFECIIEFAEG